MKILFIDDQKKPEWYKISSPHIDVATTYEEAQKLLKQNTYDVIYLDHDLGMKHLDGSHLLTEYLISGKSLQKVICISWSPIGVERIKNVCRDFNIPFELSSGGLITIDGQSG
jgi:hypothetical protein